MFDAFVEGVCCGAGTHAWLGWAAPANPAAGDVAQALGSMLFFVAETFRGRASHCFWWTSCPAWEEENIAYSSGGGLEKA